ncbi:MAG: 4'-phosphopantetheinyl transferase superfamily protein [Pseudomonadota bacterium]|nr:4'-phosphopantetheinyl transferase superfamily protein [Pseudomonadota bacterium]
MSPGQIHLWAAELGADGGKFERDMALLSHDEHARAGKIRSRQRRTNYAAGRALLRRLLHDYTGIPPADLAFRYGEHGKPALRENVGGETLCFNYSDSGSRALYAFALGAELGIDLETLPRRIDHRRLAKRVLTDNERRRLFSLPADRQQEAFLACWTRKEAYGKALGIGIRYPLNRTELLDEAAPHTKPLQILTVTLPFDGIGALATTLENAEIHGFLSHTDNFGETK